MEILKGKGVGKGVGKGKWDLWTEKTFAARKEIEKGVGLWLEKDFLG